MVKRAVQNREAQGALNARKETHHEAEPEPAAMTVTGPRLSEEMIAAIMEAKPPVDLAFYADHSSIMWLDFPQSDETAVNAVRSAYLSAQGAHAPDHLSLREVLLAIEQSTDTPDQWGTCISLIREQLLWQACRSIQNLHGLMLAQRAQRRQLIELIALMLTVLVSTRCVWGGDAGRLVDVLISDSNITTCLQEDNGREHCLKFADFDQQRINPWGLIFADAVVQSRLPDLSALLSYYCADLIDNPWTGLGYRSGLGNNVTSLTWKEHDELSSVIDDSEDELSVAAREVENLGLAAWRVG